ncbi:conserved protein of unknown function [Nitrospira japonica]|uniref:Uncharacterized protein n=1 Tax=Nitrospira japonica TaxID=1325564 RepID=A0A1W1I356_9BACT|nr:hypothetical protein [Nitrospira japonica]SLM47405.1 conserved protein of unknown function [Nitrospira japonica]
MGLRRRFVIFALPEQHGGRNFYISKSGGITDIPPAVAKFSSFAEAQAFAASHNIELTAARYIGQADFMEWDCREL